MSSTGLELSANCGGQTVCLLNIMAEGNDEFSPRERRVDQIINRAHLEQVFDLLKENAKPLLDALINEAFQFGRCHAESVAHYVKGGEQVERGITAQNIRGDQA